MDSLLVYALTDGTLGLLSIKNGMTLFEEKLEVDGLSTIATSISSNGSWLAVGTIEGRVLLYQVDKS